jgi:ribosome maturation factor RimP
MPAALTDPPPRARPTAPNRNPSWGAALPGPLLFLCLMDPFTLRAKIRDLIETTVQRLGFDLVAVEWAGSGGPGVLRVSIDALPGEPGVDGEPAGVSAGACARVSRAIEPLLDAADPISGAYALEVSSPGIDRPVQRRSDFERFIGYTIRIRLEPGPPRRRFTGEIRAISGDDLLLFADGEEHTLHLDTIERAHLVLSLEQYEALGRGLPQPPAAQTSGGNHDHQ